LSLLEACVDSGTTSFVDTAFDDWAREVVEGMSADSLADVIPWVEPEMGVSDYTAILLTVLNKAPGLFDAEQASNVEKAALRWL